MVNVTNQLKGAKTFYFGNACPYAWGIEMGSSKKAPKGMFRKNVARWTSFVRAAEVEVSK